MRWEAGMESTTGVSAPPANELSGVFDRAAATYDDVEFFTPIGAQLVAASGLRPGANVLDVGCGRGACTFPATEVVGPTGSVTAIDIAPAMVEGTLREIVARRLPNVRAMLGDGMRPPFPPARFDHVFAGLVVHMLPDPGAALRRYAELLRPGGRFAMSTFGPAEPGFFRITDALKPFVAGPLPNVPMVTGTPLASADGIRELVRGAGFTDVRVVDASADLEYPDRDSWWSWLWTTAGRIALERIPAERMPDAKAAAYEQMDALQRERGRLTVHWTVWHTFAKVSG